jgi:uncharacterized protein (TIGR00297 family)
MAFFHIFQIPSVKDWLYLLLLTLVIIILIVISEIIRKRFNWPQEVTRKIVHIGVGFLLLLTPLLFETSMPLVCIAAFFSLFNYIALRNNLLPGIHIDRNNFGTVYYAVSFLILILIFWDGFKIIIVAAMLVMAIGDAAAAIAGRSFKNVHHYILIHDRKSIEGSIVMLLVSTLIIYITFLLYPSYLVVIHPSLGILLLISVLTGLVATAAEALGDKGNDNLSVPLVSAIILFFLMKGDNASILQFFLGMFFGIVFAYFSYKVKFLTASGAVITFILATFIFGFGGWAWTLPILTFFILSSSLSKFGKSESEKIFEKGSQRDHLQVLANGGIAGILIIFYTFYPSLTFYLLYLGALAAATADTWATEIGMMKGQEPRLISNFKQVPPGTSGGITLAGTAGAITGAFILAMSGVWFVEQNRLKLLIIITLSGFLGSLFDSLLGATLQVQYKCDICNKITEKKWHCESNNTMIISGVHWVNNDMVNFFNTISGSIFALICFHLFL